jgi:hypothetical protein
MQSAEVLSRLPRGDGVAALTVNLLFVFITGRIEQCAGLKKPIEAGLMVSGNTIFGRMIAFEPGFP